MIKEEESKTDKIPVINELFDVKEHFQIGIPTYENGEWTSSQFANKDEYLAFLFSCFKEPGEMELDAIAKKFNEQARTFRIEGEYCPFTEDSNYSKFEEYWEFEKAKCTRGAIFKNGKNTYYLPRSYYFWINFTEMYDKINKVYIFPEIWDVHIYISLYNEIARVMGLDSAIVKKRQIGSSYYHVCGELLNSFWFDEGASLKMGAAESRHIDTSGSWRFLDHSKDFLNKNTAWIRQLNPGKVKDWIQKGEAYDEEKGVNISIGLGSSLVGLPLDKSPTNGVGGACHKFFYEEAGKAPTMSVTKDFMTSAIKMGNIKTGQFIAAGSVGEMKDCEPLKDYMLNPSVNGFLGIKNKYFKKDHPPEMTGLFIPEQWAMPPYIDEYGNSLVKEALEFLNKTYSEAEKVLTPEKYQRMISQAPRYLDEAFSDSDESFFNKSVISAHEARINSNEYPYERLILKKGLEGEIIVSKSNKIPIIEFPIDKKASDKEGVIQVWKRPMSSKPQWGVYFASVDPVSEGKTTTSNSLCSIYIYKRSIEVRKKNQDGGFDTVIEPDEIVACWTGRFDDINKTHERLQLLIEWYNAQVIVENNVSLFINHMIKEKKQKHLVKSRDIVFLKELGVNNQVYADYGWKNTGSYFHNHLLSYLAEWTTEVISEEFDQNGVPVKKTLGIVRLPDGMACKEMLAYKKGLNVDRLVSLAALIAFVKIKEANSASENVKIKGDENGELYKKSLKEYKKSPFSNIENKGRGFSNGKLRVAFKNIR